MRTWAESYTTVGILGWYVLLAKGYMIYQEIYHGLVSGLRFERCHQGIDGLSKIVPSKRPLGGISGV